MHRIYFQLVGQAIDHARQHGGWIALTDDGPQWFDATRWTLTPIMAAIRGGAVIGTYATIEAMLTTN